jgi:hypothetical protein
MRLRLILGVALTQLTRTCWAQTNDTAFLSAFAKVPACAVSVKLTPTTISKDATADGVVIQQQCILSNIPASACKTFSNATCICTDQRLKDVTQACLVDACSVSEVLTVGRVQADACNTPLRPQKAALMAPLAIELLGIPAVLLRLFSRWRYTTGYEIDDWIMLACLPIFIVFEVVGHICSSFSFLLPKFRFGIH